MVSADTPKRFDRSSISAPVLAALTPSAPSPVIAPAAAVENGVKARPAVDIALPTSDTFFAIASNLIVLILASCS